MRPASTTVKKLKELKGDKTFRDFAREMGYSDNALGMISDVINERPKSISLEKENELRLKMGLSPITESGRLAHKRKYERPYVTELQEQRKEDLGVSWAQVIDWGLNALEGSKKEAESKKAIWVPI